MRTNTKKILAVVLTTAVVLGVIGLWIWAFSSYDHLWQFRAENCLMEGTYKGVSCR